MDEHIVATCGHPVSYEPASDDPYAAEKRAKVAGRPCRACRIRINGERQLAQCVASAKGVRKGQEPKLLPMGTRIVLEREGDGRWSGTLEAEGTAVGAESAGLMGMASKLARAWLRARGARVKGKV